MRNLYVAVGLALCSTGVLAADFGLGVSARSEDGIVYAPIDISKSFRIEPSVRYASTEQSMQQSDISEDLEAETLEVGVGVFGIKQVTDAAHIYFGARLAYVDVESTSNSVITFSRQRVETKQDGYRIGPTVGFEYLFGQHFSVGGEASYSYLDVEGKSISESTIITTRRETLNTEQKTHGTQTRVIFRYMF
jgi:hypothetical protein